MQLKKTPAKKAKTVAEKKKATKSKGEDSKNGSTTKKGKKSGEKPVLRMPEIMRSFLIMPEGAKTSPGKASNGVKRAASSPPKSSPAKKAKETPDPVATSSAKEVTPAKNGTPTARRGRPPKAAAGLTALKVKVGEKKKVESPTKRSPRKVVSNSNSKKNADCPSMVTIHQQDLMTMIKMEPESDNESDSEVQLSAILGDKSNPIGLSDDVHVTKEIRVVDMEVNGPGNKVFSDVSDEFMAEAVADNPVGSPGGSGDKADKAQHICKVCDKTFTRMQSLKLHVQNTHSEERKFICVDCSASFVSLTALKSHMAKATICKQCDGKRICGPYNYEKHKNEHSEVTFRCTLCTQTFNHKKDLRDHEATHQTEEVTKVFSCVICSKVFQSVLSATACARMHTHHYECQVCKISCRTPAELRRHEDTHDSTKKYKCAMCSVMLKSEGSLKMHVRDKHERPAERTIACTFEGCDKMFFTLKQKSQHESSVHSEKTFQCKDCPAKFSSVAKLQKHFSLKHDENADKVASDRQSLALKVVCKVCNKELASKHYLKVHMAQHDQVKSFRCDECGKTFCRKWVMETHKKTVHMGDVSRIFQCASCPASFINVSQLNYHSKTVHTVEQSGDGDGSLFPCTIKGCDHVAKSKAQLDAHLKSLKHCDVKNFKCPVCSLTFNRKWVMEEHILRRHEDTRRQMNYKCLLCGRGFYFHKSYVRHSAVKHTQACEFCDLSFATTRYHMDHRRAVHGIVEKLDVDVKWPPCQICGKYLGGFKKMQKHIAMEHSDMPGRAGTFEENNDDPEIVLNYKKKSKKTLKKKVADKKKEKKASLAKNEVKPEEVAQ